MNKITDLAELDTVKGGDEGHEFELRHPISGDPMGAFITVVGADSERHQEHLRALQKKSVDAMMKSRRVNGVDAEQEGINLLAASTLGWRDLPLWDGLLFEYSQHNAQKLYRRFPWVREQASVVVQERANFLPKCAASSSITRNTTST
mgnify:CR=1 FL=1